MRIYVASSWRNADQPSLVNYLRRAGHEVYDFRAHTGYEWSDIDPEWESWDGRQFREALTHPLAVEGYRLDFSAMEWSDVTVLLLPCGKSAHLELGHAAGAGKPTFILLDEHSEPELMYKMATLVETYNELVEELERLAGPEGDKP